MNFFTKIIFLSNIYGKNRCTTKDRALLYGIFDSTPPLAEHIVFLPMPMDTMQEMIKNYKRQFPKELLALFQFMNGADLFWTVRIVGKKQIRIPRSCFSIYGIPLTCNREHLEPYNISVEDLNRPQGTPDSWLKFGAYYNPNDMLTRYDLYVDTDGTGVYAVEHEKNECVVSETWKNIDSCLCSIFELLVKGRTEDQSGDASLS